RGQRTAGAGAGPHGHDARRRHRGAAAGRTLARGGSIMTADVAATPVRPRVADLVVRRPHGRRAVDGVMRGLTAVAAVLLLIPLVAIVGYVIVNGLPWIDLEFLTTAPVDDVHGGALAAILGTLQMVPLATLIAAPIGIGAGIFLAEIAP